MGLRGCYNAVSLNYPLGDTCTEAYINPDSLSKLLNRDRDYNILYPSQPHPVYSKLLRLPLEPFDPGFPVWVFGFGFWFGFGVLGR